MPALADNTRASAEREIDSLSSMSDKLRQYIESFQTDRQGLISGNKELLEQQKALLVKVQEEEDEEARDPSKLEQYTEEEQKWRLDQRDAWRVTAKATVESVPGLISQLEGQKEHESATAAREVLPQVNNLLTGLRTVVGKNDEDGVQSYLKNPELNKMALTVSNAVGGADGPDEQR
jgi:hypothetical protein